jgi:hypothetical protein
MKVFHAVTGQFRESRYGFGAWSTFTYNQFVFTYVYSFPFTELRNEEDYLITEDGARFWGTKVLLLQNEDGNTDSNEDFSLGDYSNEDA